MLAWFVFALNLLVTVQAQGTTQCQVQGLSEQLGTSKYLLYGLTADCQLFFATNVPDGTDLGQKFGPQPNFNRTGLNIDCKSARLFPIRNVNNELKLMLIYMVAPQLYVHVFDFEAPKGNWYTLTTGNNNGPVISLCANGGICASAYFVQVLTSPAQQLQDQIIAYVNQTGSQFTLFSRPPSNPSSQSDMSTYSVDANNLLNRTMMTNVPLKAITALFMDPYKNNFYAIDQYYMYRYPITPMSSTVDIINRDTTDKIVYINDGHRANYYVLNDNLFRLQYQTSNQANIVIQTIPAILNSTQYTLNTLPSKCIGQLLRPSELSYSSLDNFQMSVLLYDNYDAVMQYGLETTTKKSNETTTLRSGQRGIYESYSVKLLAILALILRYHL